MEVATPRSERRPVDQDLLDAAMQGKMVHLESALARGANVNAQEQRV
jgi:hypothetical protein